MSTADPIKASGTFYPDTIDPMMAAIRQAIVDAPGENEQMQERYPALAEFTAETVTVIAPQETDQDINDKVAEACARADGLCLLLIAGSGKNPNTDAPGPRMNIELEAQLFVNTTIREDDARTPLVLMAAIAKFLHQQEIRVTGFPWFEEILCTGYDSLPDPDFTAYVITFTRETTL